MSNTIQTPNMLLDLPIPTVELGPAWALELNTALTSIDSHDHSIGKGVLVTPAGLNISSDLSFNSNNAISLRTSRYTSQSGSLSLPTDIGCVYVVSGELFYNDLIGNKVQITLNGSVQGSSGTITGLPSGTASAAYSAVPGTFVFQQATSTAANMDIGSLILRYPGSYPTPSGNYIILEVPSGISSGYALVLPGLPSQTNVMTLSSGGVISSSTYNAIGLNITTLAKNATSGSDYVVVSNTNATSQIAVIRARVNAGGGLDSGEGVNATHSGLGQYTLVFNTDFADIPAIGAIVDTSGSRVTATYSSTSTSGTIVYLWDTNGNPVNSSFSFMAMGQRT